MQTGVPEEHRYMNFVRSFKYALMLAPFSAVIFSRVLSQTYSVLKNEDR